MNEQAHILLVDDEDAVTRTLTPFLRRSGFVVSTARDGEEALRRLPEVRPDLIILDVLMPKMDGRAVLRHLRQNSDWTPVILLTQVGESVERAMALEEGADDYINTAVPSHTVISTPITVAPSATADPSPTYTLASPQPAPTNTAVPTTTDVPSPTIFQFSVSPQTVEPWTWLRLNWDAAGDRAEICVFQNGYTGYRECRETAVSGAIAWELDDMLRDDFAVELLVSKGEQVVTKVIPVAVTCPVAEDWWFFTPAPAGCPGTGIWSGLARGSGWGREWLGARQNWLGAGR